MTDEEHLQQYQVIAGYVWRWQFAMGRQAERTIDPADTMSHEVEAHFFAIALKNLRASVEWARDACNGARDGERGGPLAKALQEFDDAVPNAPDVRDIQEHFIAYETGDKKRHLQHVPAPLAIWWESDETTVIVNVGGYRLDVKHAADAAHTLAQKALEALTGATVRPALA